MTQQLCVAAIFLATVAVLVSTNVDARRLRIAPRPVVRDDPPKCDQCTAAVTKVLNTLTNPNTTAEAKQLLEVICQFKPDDKDRQECRAKLDGEVDKVVANITATLSQPLAFCEKYQLCEEQVCDKCIDGVKTIYNQVFGPGGVVEKIRLSAEDYFCGKLPDFLKKTCDRVVDASVNNLFAKIQNKLNDPQEVCQELKVCNKSEIITLNGDKLFQQVIAAPKNDVPCAICEGLGLAIFIALEEGKSPAEIESRLDAVCQKLPIEDLKVACKKFLDENLDKFIPAVKASNGNVIQACQSINLCMNNALKKAEEVERVNVEAAFVSELVAAGTPRTDVPCAMCQGIGLAIFIALEEGKTQAEIEARLDMICQKLPIDDLKTACKKFLDENMDKFIPAVKESNGNIPQACQAINLCKNNNDENEEEQNHEEEVIAASVAKILNPEAGYPCAVCEGMGLAIYIALLEGKTEDQIIHRMQTICDRLPGKLQEICDKFVQTDLQIFIPAIKASNGNVRGACMRIGLCVV